MTDHDWKVGDLAFTTRDDVGGARRFKILKVNKVTLDMQQEMKRKPHPVIRVRKDSFVGQWGDRDDIEKAIAKASS